MELWGPRCPRALPVAERRPQVGPTPTATCGFSADLDSILQGAPGHVISMTFGDSPHPPMNGRGWEGTAKSPLLVSKMSRATCGVAVIQECMESLESELGRIFREEERVQRRGLTKMAISGSSEGLRSMRPTGFTTSTTICGNSSNRQRRGRGWGEPRVGHCTIADRIRPTTSLPVDSPVSTERCRRRVRGARREAAARPQAGWIPAAICGSLEAMVSMTREDTAYSMTYGSSILPLASGPGWVGKARFRDVFRIGETPVRLVP